MESDTPTDAELRAMRDRVYGVPTTSNNWAHCGENWTKPDEIRWLNEHQPEEKT